MAIVTQTDKRSDEIKAARRYLGYPALIINEEMDAFTALHLYRMKDVVGKSSGNIKERLNSYPDLKSVLAVRYLLSL